MSVDKFMYIGRGVVIRHNNLVKWEFYSEVAKEFHAYVDYDETNTRSEDIPR